MTILDIDLDFFVTPIKHWGATKDRLDEDEFSVEDTASAIEFLERQCRMPVGPGIPGAVFENHDDLFDYGVANWNEPVHLIHVDAHADIGGGLTSCWHYVTTEYTHQDPKMRRFPKRGSKYLNCGNFIVFMAGCGLLKEITFVSHPSWSDDYNPIYMKGFDPSSEAIQLKRFDAKAIANAGITEPLYWIQHEVEDVIPIRRIPRQVFQLDTVPDAVVLTRSPSYTPSSADVLFEEIGRRIKNG
jgi:hypothetical protein